MAARFKVGKTYHIKHDDGMWEGHVKVLDVDDDGCPRVVVTKFIEASKQVRAFFNSFGPHGCKLGEADWSPKMVNTTLENK